MAFKVGSFTQPTSTGNFDVTGLGFNPVGVMFYYTYLGSSNQLAQGLGMSDGTSQFCEVWCCDNGAGTMNTGRDGATTASIMLRSGVAASVIKQASCSMITDGFRLNYSTADATSGLTVRYIAVGGPGVSCKVGSFTEGGATGIQNITGVGFQPEALFVAHFHQAASPSNVAGAFCGFGMASSPADQFAWMQYSVDNQANSSVVSWQATGKLSLGYDGGSNDWEMDLDAFTSDGFDLDCTNARTGGDIWHGYMALRGARFKVGTIIEPASASSVAETGVGFKPSTLFFTGTGHPSHALVDTRSMHTSWGASQDGGNEWSQSAQDQDNAGTSVTRNYESSTKAISTMVDTGVNTQSEADITAFGSDGFTAD